MTFTAQQKLDAVEREIKMRVRVYDRRVHEKKMTRDLADFQIGVMRAIADDYRAVAEKERLL